MYGASAVALGAFGAHGLRKRVTDPAKIASWSTAANYQVSIIYSILSDYKSKDSIKLLHSGVLLLATSLAPRNKVCFDRLVYSMSF